jgi:hypothetical protein
MTVIAAAEASLRAGHADVKGLCLALADWSAELRILMEREKPPGLKPAAGLCERSGTQALIE